MNTVETIQKEIDRLDFRVEQAYSNMKRCVDDDHREGETMWYSLALDREQERDQYHQKVLTALGSVL